MAKQTMGKDQNGVFHPGKGKPSGVNKEEGLGIQATPPEKMNEYIENGAELGWLIDPANRKVYVYRQNKQTEVLDAAEEIKGEPLLPGFVLVLTDVWN